jgi:sulfatase modifying factor 1
LVLGYVGLQWNEAQRLESRREANKLSELEGLDPVYTINGDDVSCNWNAKGYRLPTEAEWE